MSYSLGSNVKDLIRDLIGKEVDACDLSGVSSLKGNAAVIVWSSAAEITRQVVHAYNSGELDNVLLVTKTSPGYVWWDDLFCAGVPLCVSKGRLDFIDDTDGSRWKAQAATSFFLLSKSPKTVLRFRELFSTIGRVI